ncbi:MAG: hypothetical protein ABH867_05200 [Patescibacteria group bacterium]
MEEIAGEAFVVSLFSSFTAVLPSGDLFLEIWVNLVLNRYQK